MFMIHANALSRLFLISSLAATAACQSSASHDADDPAQARWQALLRDEPLAHVPPGADASARASDRARAIPPGVDPLAAWNFDDCSPAGNELSDATAHGATAFRATGVTCGDGIQGSPAVSIAAPDDIIYVPDRASFALGSGATVAGWFRPASLDGTATLFRKRDGDSSSLALVLDGGKFELVVNLGDDRAIGVASPTAARVGAFQHVAATYDGQAARLYIDGAEVAHADATGAIATGHGPVLIGNDGSQRRFSGAIDSALFAGHAIGGSDVLALNCLAEPPALQATPAQPSTHAGDPATVDLAITNRNSAACAPAAFSVQTVAADSALATQPPLLGSVNSAPIASGDTGHVTLTATPGAAAAAGGSLSFEVAVADPSTQLVERAAVVIAVDCRVDTPRELMITSLSVVDDPVRTSFDPASGDPRNGAWTFKHLMENMAATPADAPAMVEALFGSFTTDQTINGFTIASRPFMQSEILSGWPRTPDGALDLARAPLRLQAIVNRFDLRNLDNGDAGEGRFVFAFVDQVSQFPLQAMLILEYKLPAATEQELVSWAQGFHALGALPFGDGYNAALQALTERFAGRNARPGHPNGSAINAVRTNEIAFGGPWQLREFGLSAASGRLEPVPVALTPDLGFNNTPALASYINDNQAAIIAETHTLPTQLGGQPFQGGTAINNLATWRAPGVDPEARFHFAINTCNGCHSQETGSGFLQISPRFSSSEATLSPFLTGTTVNDPVTGQPRTLNDLARRNAGLASVVCPAPHALPHANLRRGIQRVH